jgi:trigger factor
MKTNTKNLDKCQVELTVEIAADEIKAIVKEVEKSFMREAALPGFRKGKVPVEIIRREFTDSLKQEVERTMFQRNYADAVKAEALEEVAIADVRDVKYSDEGGSFTAVVEVKPKFKLPAYKGLKIEFKDAKVEPEAVQEQVERLRAAYAKYEDAKEGEAVADGDFVQIDYSGTIGKKPILEINPEAKIVAGGEGFWTQVEEGRFLPEILDAVKGMKAGETKEGIWLAEHCHEFGFIIRYPADKEEITGYMYEPWHIRYVGADLAKTLTESGQCLEEYFGIQSYYEY